MGALAWLQIIVILLAIFLLSIPTGRYMARVVMGRQTRSTGFSIRSTTRSIFSSAAKSPARR